MRQVRAGQGRQLAKYEHNSKHALTSPNYRQEAIRASGSQTNTGKCRLSPGAACRACLLGEELEQVIVHASLAQHLQQALQANQAQQAAQKMIGGCARKTDGGAGGAARAGVSRLLWLDAAGRQAAQFTSTLSVARKSLKNSVTNCRGQGKAGRGRAGWEERRNGR